MTSLTLDLACRLGGRAISFTTFVRVQEALLLLAPKAHLVRLFDIRSAIMDHINTSKRPPTRLFCLKQERFHQCRLLTPYQCA